MNIAHEVDKLYTACALVAAGLGVCLVPAGVQDSHSTSSMVLRPVTPALPHIDMHIALAYKPQSTNELVPLFVDVVKDVVKRHSGPRPMRVASV
jgi:DNA-binding transcriptional LysR family regulator